MAAVYIPRLLKHVVLAIWKKRAARTFPDALQMARAHMVQGGYLAHGSDKGDLSEMRLTPKGRKRERERMRESTRKVREFDRLYEKHAKELEKGRKDRESPDDPEES